jgi:hypothetical protein
MERVTIRQQSTTPDASQETEIILESDSQAQYELEIAALSMMERMGHDVNTRELDQRVQLPWDK